MEIINPKIKKLGELQEVGEPKEAWWTPKEHDSKTITYKFEKRKKGRAGGSARSVKKAGRYWTGKH